MKKSLSSRLRTLRGEQSQSEFAAKLATKQTTYSSWERGIKEPSLEVVSEISLQFGVSADYLLGLTDDPTPASQRHAAGAVTVNAIWPEYERICRSSERPLSPKTMLDRRNCVKRLLGWVTETHPLLRTMQDVSTVVASAFADHLRKSGAASKTRRNIIADLGTVWRTVGTVHDCASPWGNVIPLATVTTPGRAFSREEEVAVLKAADAAGHGWGLMCRVARCTGLRYGDVARIEGRDVDRNAGALRLKPSKTRRHGISVLLPLSDALVAMLSDTHGPVFKEAASHYPDMIRTCPFSKVLADAGLSGRGYTFHSWRHTFRTRLSEAGVSDDLAKRLGGWTQDATAARYDHATRLGELRAAVESAL